MILITLWFVDRILERQRERIQLPLKRLAVKRLIKVVTTIVDVIARMEKSASDGWVPQNLEEILSPKGAALISLLDRDKLSGFRELSWKECLRIFQKEMQQELEKLIDLYAAVLPPSLLELLEWCANESPLNFSITVDEVVTESYKSSGFESVASVAAVMLNALRQQHKAIGAVDPIVVMFAKLYNLWNSVDNLAKDLHLLRPSPPLGYLRSTNGETPALGSARLSEEALRRMGIGTEG